MAARKKSAPSDSSRRGKPQGVRCPDDLEKFIEDTRSEFNVSRSDVWRWCAMVARRELTSGRVTGPGVPGIPPKGAKNV